MKVRTGFVSNSSSSSFIVFVPEEFIVNDIVINYMMEKLDKWDKEEMAEEGEIVNGTFSEGFISNLTKIVERLKAGEIVYQDDAYTANRLIISVLKKYGFVLAEIDGGPDEGTTQGITAQKINKILSTANKKEWLNEV